MNSEQVERHLRYRIVGLLHVGGLRRGDALPSIRNVARETGADHRAVAAAYRALEAEGLVEIRPGAGVYLAGGAGDGVLRSETARWLGGVLLEGWGRRIARARVAELVARCAGTPVRCACVESNEDHMVAVAAELEGDFSLEVEPVLVNPGATAGSIPRAPLAEADVVVSTVFHEAEARAAADRAGRPFVLLSLNPEFAAEVGRRITGRDVVAVVADPRFVVRARAHLDVTQHRGSVRMVLADELRGPDAEEVDFDSATVLATRAARRRLGLPDFHLVPSPPTYVSPASARELCERIAELGLGAPHPGE